MDDEHLIELINQFVEDLRAAVDRVVEAAISVAKAIVALIKSLMKYHTNKRVRHLARYHRKARVRKKNLARIFALF